MLIHISEFRGRTILNDLKHSDKRGKTGEARTDRHVSDGVFRISQQLFGCSNPLLVQIFIERNIGKLLKQPGEMELAESGQIRYIVQCQVFCAVCADVITDGEKFFDIGLLFAACGIKVLRTLRIIAADQYEQ